MSLNGLRKGQRVKMGASEFQIVQRIPDQKWQNTATGEWCTFSEHDLLDRFARNTASAVPRWRSECREPGLTRLAPSSGW